MRKIEKIIFALMSTLLLGAVLVSWVSNFQKQNPVETEESDAQTKPSYTVTGSLKIPDYFTFGEEDAYVVSEDFVEVGKDYILSFEDKRLNSSDDYSYRTKSEYLKFAYKKIDDPNAKTNVVNLSELANAYKEGYYLELNKYILNHNGIDYLVFFLGNDYETDDERYDLIALAYNLEEGRLSDFSEALSAIDINSKNFSRNGEYATSLFNPLYDTGLVHKLDVDINFSIRYYSNEDSRYNYSVNLFSENPDLKAQLENGKNVFIYPRYDGVTPEKWFNQILHWFAPVGEETLTTYMKTGSDTIKSTPITSYADYLSLKGQVDAE